MDRSTIMDLIRHMHWADATVWVAVLSSEAGRLDTNLRDRLYHLHLVQRVFLRLWRGEPRDDPPPTFTDAETLMQWAQTYYTEAFGHLEMLADTAITEPMDVPWAAMVERRLGRAPESTTVGETALQVVMHSMYHRGQVNMRLRDVGGEPALVDYIAWVWLGRPDAVWPSPSSGDASN